MNKPTIAITMGDPAGIGPEVCLHALKSAEISDLCTPVLFGDADILKRCARKLKLNDRFPVFPGNDVKELQRVQQPAIADVTALDHAVFEPGRIDANTVAASFAYINSAIDAAIGQLEARGAITNRGTRDRPQYFTPSDQTEIGVS